MHSRWRKEGQDIVHADGCTAPRDTPKRLDARPGSAQTYQVHVQGQVNGRNRFWTWVVDEADEQVGVGTSPGMAIEKG
jgi:hypothetical protein